VSGMTNDLRLNLW